MGKKKDEKCVCGHKRSDHHITRSGYASGCLKLVRNKKLCSCQEFVAPKPKPQKSRFSKTVKKLKITNKKKALPKVAWSRDLGDGDGPFCTEKSWRDEYEAQDVIDALKFAGLTGWSYETRADGDIQFSIEANETTRVSFDDLAKLRITFTPVTMIIEALTEEIDGPPKLYVTMSWNPPQ